MYCYENINMDSVIIGYDAEEYILDSIDGVDYLNNNIKIVKSLYQDGSTVVSEEIEERDIKIVGKFIANEFSKENLMKVFNPKVHGTLYHIKDGIKKRISCIVETSPIFKVGSFLHEFQVKLIAHDPYWRGEEIEVEFASITPNIEFPVYFTQEFEISTVESIKAKNIQNKGDVKAPILVEFKANGPVTNPYLKSSDSELRLNKINLMKGDKVIITTEMNNKNVMVYRADGTVEKGFKYVHYMSTYIQLPIGITKFTFGAETGEENLEIKFKFTPRYMGVI